MAALSAWLKKLRPRKTAPEMQPAPVAVPVSIGGSKPIEYVIIEEIKTVVLYIEANNTPEVYQEFEAQAKRKGYYLQVLQFKKE